MAGKTTGQGIDVKDLTFFALFSLTFGSMMGSGVFDIPQNIANRSGAVAVVLHWGIVAAGMIALAWSFVYISNKRPDIKSGIYGYAKFGFGDYVGFTSAWGYFLNALLGNASYLIYIFATLGNFFPVFGHGATAGATLPSFLCESLLLWIVMGLIIKGVKEASIVNIIITSVKLMALAALILVFIYGFKTSVFMKNMSTHDLHLGSMFEQIKATMLVTVWDFLGIEAACIYAIYAKSMKDVGKATMLAVIAVLLIDTLLSCLPFGIMPTAEVQQLTTPSTAGVMALVIGPISANIIRFAVLICVVGALLAWNMLATNILFLSAQDKTMPRFLTKLNKGGVPVNAAIMSGLTLQVMMICAYFSQAVYLNMIMIATSLVLVPYLLAAMFSVKLILTDKKVHYYELIKGSLAVLYAVWMIYAGGLKYLAISTLMYLIGIFLFYKARREDGRRLFENKFEIVLFTTIVICAIASGWAWYTGVVQF
ncbi:basic amino acid/polyamine antiporter [Aquella oligotrophica]|uniref:Arginine-ornithine antiporter n=1 Tax=Aquella oligotrophica TaxID=2067065 RepID=A0A2I7N9E4_9NEIS|nr:basic amino acid/polyamine antiporter [Aquella oligotrophica]AUR53088.1 arginine-ornithine antiporter [Aquella oligotrophica]